MYSPVHGLDATRLVEVTPKQRKEEISKAYVHAVVAACGYSIGRWTQDHGCIDTTVSAVLDFGGTLIETKPKLDLQLKATSRQDRVRADHVTCVLQRAHYERLRAPSKVPHLLVVLVLPELRSAQVEHTADALLVRRCAWWVEMTGMPPLPSGRDSTTVHLPRAQVFSPRALRRMMDTLSRGESL